MEDGGKVSPRRKSESRCRGVHRPWQVVELPHGAKWQLGRWAGPQTLLRNSIPSVTGML